MNVLVLEKKDCKLKEFGIVDFFNTLYTRVLCTNYIWRPYSPPPTSSGERHWPDQAALPGHFHDSYQADLCGGARFSHPLRQYGCGHGMGRQEGG